MPQKIYRPNKFRLYTQTAFRGAVLFCAGVGVIATIGTVYQIGKYYLFDKPEHNRQRREYAQALMRKERREKELGLRD